MSLFSIVCCTLADLNPSLPVFTEHNLTYNYLTSLGQEHLQWTIFCPSQMVPASKTINLLDAPRGNPFKASVDVPADFQRSYVHSIPFLGPLIGILINFSRYGTTLEDCADFIAAYVAKKDTTFVGHRVSVIDGGTAGKGKTE